MWQDLVISVVGFLFAIMVIPQLIDSIKGKSFVNMWTSGLTAIGLSILAFCFATMEMWVSTAAEIAVALAWFLAWMLAFLDATQ